MVEVAGVVTKSAIAAQNSPSPIVDMNSTLAATPVEPEPLLASRPHMNGIVDIVDWFVDEKIIGLPVAIPLVVAALIVSALGATSYRIVRRRNSINQQATAQLGGKVQQTNVQNVRSDGDVNVRARQD
jgi:hypothetical protein